MSHITHTYHLAALDYINASHLGHPYNPSVAATDMLDGSTGIGAQLVNHYVEALGVRRKVHTMSALIGGRHPMQNAIVPGGATTLLNHANGHDALTTFKALLDEVRTFINTTYLLDVVTVATYYGFGTNGVAGPYNGIGMHNYFAYGTGCGNLLSYGDFEIDDTATPVRLLSRGRIHIGAPTTVNTFDHRRIVEYVDWSHYEDYSPFETAAIVQMDSSSNQVRHPWDGQTKVSFEKAVGSSTSYSWMKAPRYLAVGGEAGGYAANDPIVYEVGPLARMVNTYVSDPTVQNNVLGTDPLVALGNNYKCRALVNGALDIILGTTTAATAVHANVAALWSVLGRHGARMLECKYLADAMAVWIDEVIANRTSVNPYTYIKVPKTLKKGVGLVEAPRGALGHWIKIEKKRVLKYQCVVPSTWNISPRDANGQLGAAEAIIDVAGTLGNGTNVQNQVIDILRMLHTFDFCSACAIHLVKPDKSVVAIIHAGTDGSVRVEYPE